MPTANICQPEVEIVNCKELRVTVASGPYYAALHLLNGRETVEKRPNSLGKTFSFSVRNPGSYGVKIFHPLSGRRGEQFPD